MQKVGLCEQYGAQDTGTEWWCFEHNVFWLHAYAVDAIRKELEQLLKRGGVEPDKVLIMEPEDVVMGGLKGFIETMEQRPADVPLAVHMNAYKQGLKAVMAFFCW